MCIITWNGNKRFNVTALSETEILTHCQKGDKQAFGYLVKKYMKRAYFTALGFVHNHDRALDLSQQAFVNCWKAIKSVKPESTFFTWYYAALKNLCLNDIRNTQNKARCFSEIGEIDWSQIEHKQNDETSLLEKQELQEAVWKEINSMQEDYREILLLREFQELSYNEIVEILECPLGTVMSRLYAARKALKEKLQDKIKDHI